jgi:hypothetical protein
MSDAERIVATLDKIRDMREQCAKIAAIEAHYWEEVDDERIQLIAIGAMGAAANICVAILTARTPEQHRTECNTRGKDVTP